MDPRDARATALAGAASRCALISVAVSVGGESLMVSVVSDETRTAGTWRGGGGEAGTKPSPPTPLHPPNHLIYTLLYLPAPPRQRQRASADARRAVSLLDLVGSVNLNRIIGFNFDE